MAKIQLAIDLPELTIFVVMLTATTMSVRTFHTTAVSAHVLHTYLTLRSSNIDVAKVKDIVDRPKGMQC